MRPFPPPFSARCHLGIYAWQTSMQIRNFVIYNRGFLPTVPAIRQADALYNNTLYGQALETYMRLLETATDPAYVMELNYKIGMCFVREGAFSQARGWFSKIVALPDNDFWYRTGCVASLDTYLFELSIPEYLKKAKTHFSFPENQNAAWASLMRAKNTLKGEGFFDLALLCLRTLLELEKPDTTHVFMAEIEILDILQQLAKHEEAKKAASVLLGNKQFPEPLRLNTLQIMADILLNQGEFDGTADVLRQLRTRTRSEYFLLFCDIHQGAILRGQGRFLEAIAMFSGAIERYPKEPSYAVYSLLLGTHVYLMLGKTEKAWEVLRDAEKNFPQNSNVSGNSRTLFFYPPLVFEKLYKEAAEILLSGSKKTQTYRAANHMVRAGILFELADDHDQAVSVWSEVVRRFRPDRFCFYGDLARSFIDGTEGVLEKMPYAAMYRAEMFFLAGLLYKKRAEDEKADRLFHLAVKEDPALNWYAWLAKGEIEKPSLGLVKE